MPSTPPPTPPPTARKTRVVFLDGGQRRRSGGHARTMLPTSPMGGARPYRGDVGALPHFQQHFRSIRDFVGAYPAGVAVFAVDLRTQRLVGRLWVAGRPGELGTAILGRHSSCDLMLDGDPSVSNRHVALLVEPLSSWRGEDVRFRLVDLRTGTAMRTDTGDAVESLLAEGPVFVQLGAYLLMVFQTGGLGWPKDAREAWAQLPHLPPIDERAAEPDQWHRWALRQQGQRRITLLPAALPADRQVMGPPVGRVRLRSLWGEVERDLGQAECARGVLLGREPRCDFAGLLRVQEISRVHLMIQRIGATLHVLDAGSMAGLYALEPEGPRRVRTLPLDVPRKLALGEGYAYLDWEPLLLH